MPTYVSNLTANPPVVTGTAQNNVNGKGATAAVSGFVNGIQLGGSTAPYIPAVQGAPARPSVGQLWPRGR
jgi:hypothetical protein